MSLFLEILRHFKLRPYKINIKVSLILSNLPPKPAFDQLPNQRAIVPSTNPRLIPLITPYLLFTLHLHIHPIAPLHFEQQFPIRYNPRLVDRILILHIDLLHRRPPPFTTSRLFSPHPDRLRAFCESALSVIVSNTFLQEAIVVRDVLAVLEV
jgi:hypothetical protein